MEALRIVVDGGRDRHRWRYSATFFHGAESRQVSLMTDGPETDAAGGQGAVLLELDASAVAAAPVLGHHPGEFVDPISGTVRRIARPQDWIAMSASSVTINVVLFNALKPFDHVLDDGTSTSQIVASLTDELAANWTGPKQVARQPTSTPVAAVSVRGNRFRALVWCDSMLISAADPVATALQLMIAGFSAKAASQHVKPNQRALENALEVLRPEVRETYVPNEKAYIAEAEREHARQAHETFEAKRQKLNTMRRPYRLQR